MKTRWTEIALAGAKANPDIVINDAAVTGLTPPAAAWLAEHPAPLPASQAIVLPLPPSANRYWRSIGNRAIVSEDARAYKAGIWLAAQHAGFRPFVGPVAVHMQVYRGRKAGDLDNYGKVLLDALTGIAYQDDGQVVEIHSYRHDDKDNPRVEVEVRQVTA